MGGDCQYRPKEQVVAMQDELISAFLDDTFQQRLHAAWGDPAIKERLREVRRRQICLEVQGPILERYGYENSHRGLMQSYFTSSIRDDEEVGLKALIMEWLTHPASPAWRFLWPRLHTFQDLSWPAFSRNCYELLRVSGHTPEILSLPACV